MDLQERKNEMLRKEKEVEQRLRYIKKREIELRKMTDEIRRLAHYSDCIRLL